MPSPPVASSLDALLRSDLASDHSFAWSGTRRLRWSDFQGSPPGGGREGAKTAYTLFYAWKCRGPAFEFRSIAAFRPGQSWVKVSIVRDSAESRRALGHEQTHFDLSEVHARRMREHFGALRAPCDKTDAELSAIAQRFVQGEKADQHRYDDETNHGLLADPQSAWTRAAARQLAALSRYGS
jgi:uncharacterized protein DUF922